MQSSVEQNILFIDARHDLEAAVLPLLHHGLEARLYLLELIGS
jgi:hypothetical protein